MWLRGQLHKTKGKDIGPGDIGHLMGFTWYVPDDEVVVITVRYPKTMSELGLGRMWTNLIVFRPSTLSSKSWADFSCSG
jgi:hypothetical protein